MEGRCMKCKDQKKMASVEMTKTARGGFMAKGKCSVCGTGVCKIMSAGDAEKAMKSGEAKKAF
jgi:hypothetical protein